MITNRAFISPSLTVFGLTVALVVAGTQQVHAAPRDAAGNAKIVNKLQAMVKEISSERDTLKTEKETLATELDKLKKELEQNKAAIKSATSEKDKLGSELSAQMASTAEMKTRLDNTTAKLHEVIDKYNALNRSKSELDYQHSSLQNTQKNTASELKACSAKNVKMFQVTKDIMTGYKSCHDRGFIDTLVESEKVLQLDTIEFDTLMQEFEDKLDKQKYHSQPDVSKANPAK